MVDLKRPPSMPSFYVKTIVTNIAIIVAKMGQNGSKWAKSPFIFQRLAFKDAIYLVKVYESIKIMEIVRIKAITINTISQVLSAQAKSMLLHTLMGQF